MVYILSWMGLSKRRLQMGGCGWCLEDLEVQNCGHNEEGKFFSASGVQGGWTNISAKVNPKRMSDGWDVLIDIASCSEGNHVPSSSKGSIGMFQDFNPVPGIGKVQRWVKQ